MLHKDTEIQYNTIEIEYTAMFCITCIYEGSQPILTLCYAVMCNLLCHVPQGIRYMRIVPSLAASMSTATPEPAPGYAYDTLAITQPSQHVFQVNINRPKNLNAMNKAFWRYAGVWLWMLE